MDVSRHMDNDAFMLVHVLLTAPSLRGVTPKEFVAVTESSEKRGNKRYEVKTDCRGLVIAVKKKHTQQLVKSLNAHAPPPPPPGPPPADASVGHVLAAPPFEPYNRLQQGRSGCVLAAPPLEPTSWSQLPQLHPPPTSQRSENHSC